MSMIGNTPGVSSQRVITEEVITGSAKAAFTPVGGYSLGYVDVLINGLEVDSNDFTAADGVNINLAVAAAVGDTVKVKAWLPRGLSDGYLKSEADARFLNLAGGQLTGNVSIGAALSNWGSAHKALQFGTAGAVSSDTGWSRLWQNAYSDGSNYRYAANGAAGVLLFGNQGLYAYTAGSGTAGNVATMVNTLGLDASGNVSPSGNLVLASGKGIDFSANSNAGGVTNEVLNDYETGTWTPVLGGFSTVNYDYRVGSYTKIGNMVYAFWDFNVGNKSGSGNNQISGLPFNVSGSMAGYSVAVHRSSDLFNTNGASGGQLRGFAQQNNAYIELQVDYATSSSFGFATAVGYNSAGRSTGFIIYQAA